MTRRRAAIVLAGDCANCWLQRNSSDASYFSRAFGEPRRFAATSESISDALGYCPRHGATLLSYEHLSRGIAHVFRDLIPGLIPLLSEKYFHEDLFQKIFFAASSSCPACAFDNRRVGRRARRLARQFASAPDQTGYGRLETICVRHFQILAGELKPELRMAALTRYVETLDNAAKTMEALLQSAQEMGAWPLHDAVATLNHALDLIAGKSVPNLDHDGNGLAEALRYCPSLAEGIAYPKACPLCLEADRIRQRWIRSIPVAAKLDQGAWFLFPTCPEHIWAVVRLDDLQLTTAVVAHALHIAIGQIHQQILALVRAAEITEELALAAAAAHLARWGRRRRRKISEGRKPAPPRSTKCPQCERLAIAEVHATYSLLELLKQREPRDTFNRGYGLCMKHFAQVYLMTSKGVVRTTLVEGQQEKLAEFALMLNEVDRGIPENETTALQNAPWRLVLQRFCGFM